MTLFPTNIKREVLQHFLGRTHHRQWPTRVFSAFVIAWLIFALEGLVAGILSGLWFIGVGVLEYTNFKHRSRQEILAKTANQTELDQIMTELFVSISVLGAFYALPVFGLTFGDQNGKILGLVLGASVLMNIAGQHVLHPRLILFSLPFPAFAFTAAVMSLAGAGAHPSLLFFVATIFILQTALLTLAATRSDRALIEAEREAVREATARGEADSASEAKSNFLANMSHELRTPLNAVIGYGEILRENAEFEGRLGDIGDIDKVLLSGKRLLTLVGEILDVSKIEAGAMQVEAISFDVTRELYLAIDMVRPVAQANNNKLNVTTAPDLGWATSDALRFSQCVLNLLSNAAKFTRDGTISLNAVRRMGPTGEMISVTVDDTGIGMSPDQLAKLFKPFAQADSSTTRQYGGTGLGLSLSRSLAQLMGGDVSVQSALGVGSRFELTILAAPV
jgi:signal transduction histidine kinase